MNKTIIFLYQNEEIYKSPFTNIIGKKPLEKFLSWAITTCEDHEKLSEKISQISLFYEGKNLMDYPPQTKCEEIFKEKDFFEIKLETTEQTNRFLTKNKIIEESANFSFKKNCEIIKNEVENWREMNFFKNFMDVEFELNFSKIIDDCKLKIASLLEELKTDLLKKLKENEKKADYEKNSAICKEIMVNCGLLLDGSEKLEKIEKTYQETIKNYDFLKTNLLKIKKIFEDNKTLKQGIFKTIEKFTTYNSLFFKYFDYEDLIPFGQTKDTDTFSVLFEKIIKNEEETKEPTI